MTGSGLDDGALLAAHLSGDRFAFAELMRRHEQRVYGVCLRLLGNREDAQDATQDAFLAVLRGASGYRHTAAFSTWLYRIAVNAATDQARRRGRTRTTPLDPEDAGLAAQTGDPGETVTSTVAVQSALARIPDDFRVAVVLCDLVKLPYAEVAEILGVPVGTVKSRVYRGRLALADLLGGGLPDRQGSDRQGSDRPQLRVVSGLGTERAHRSSESDERPPNSQE